jgi:demethylmenaquinone methyltransferase / 2-methoxy-6-polyprenyl-1,4-benzoquinol methylase
MSGTCIRDGGEGVRSVMPTVPNGVISHVERTAPDFVRKLFNDTAPYYDTFNRLVSLGSGGWYRRRCLIRAGLKPGQSVLDVAIGTGLIAYSAQELVGREGTVIGLDLSEAMLAEARRKVDIPLVQGMADSLPFADASIDFLVMGYAIRHISDLEACFREFRRVLKLGGTLLLLEISKPAKVFFRTVLARYLGRAVPRLSYWITRQPRVRALMSYHWETMEACVSPAVISDAMAKAGFAELVCETWFDLFRSYVGQRDKL